ncbi:hypothetical protein Ae201684P_016626 [Aphanomyces euteiches]|nr:hypothetical protein Ae201684P_016626 [Aphanomyces euteiches]
MDATNKQWKQRRNSTEKQPRVERATAQPDKRAAYATRLNEQAAAYTRRTSSKLAKVDETSGSKISRTSSGTSRQTSKQANKRPGLIHVTDQQRWTEQARKDEQSASETDKTNKAMRTTRRASSGRDDGAPAPERTTARREGQAAAKVDGEAAGVTHERASAAQQTTRKHNEKENQRKLLFAQKTDNGATDNQRHWLTMRRRNRRNEQPATTTRRQGATQRDREVAGAAHERVTTAQRTIRAPGGQTRQTERTTSGRDETRAHCSDALQRMCLSLEIHLQVLANQMSLLSRKHWAVTSPDGGFMSPQRGCLHGGAVHAWCVRSIGSTVASSNAQATWGRDELASADRARASALGSAPPSGSCHHPLSSRKENKK